VVGGGGLGSTSQLSRVSSPVMPVNQPLWLSQVTAGFRSWAGTNAVGRGKSPMTTLTSPTDHVIMYESAQMLAFSVCTSAGLDRFLT
jgi:hypothetical protein